MRDVKAEIKAIFLEALECNGAAELMRFLEQACGSDTAMRTRVNELLRAHRDAGAFLGGLPSAEAQGGPERPGDTPDFSCDDAPDNPAIDFLAPSEKPGSVGRLGHYEVLEVLGHGGMGIVLRAFDEKLHRVVAIKVMAAQLAINATARKRFTREARAQAAVCNDNVVTIHAVEEANLQPYFVMQFVAGLSLQQRLDRDGPLALPEVLRIGMQTASALAAAHAQGLVHRDIKPANILLENGVERVKVTDFGLARAGADASLTQSGVVTGTPQYMSPEQAEGRAIDPRTDLFSLGSVLYAMCTGRAPFRASSSMAVLKRVCEETPAPIHDTNPEMPDWLVAIIDKLHAKDRTERFQSAAEVAALLGRHLARVQHPSVAPLPEDRGSRIEDRGSNRGQLSSILHSRSSIFGLHRRWAITAAAVALLLGGLSLTEATGVSNLRATVVRIFTPDGMLIVEVDDPGVKVTIEDDGGLVIASAGLEEIRLRPGSYRVQADKDGKRVPLDRELVSIAKGGREIVKVKLQAPPTQVSANAEKGAFVLLGGGTERRFDTLAEAVRGASNGGTIEVRGNGPFQGPPNQIRIDVKALVIRAGPGFHPVLVPHPEMEQADLTMLLAHSVPLTLEGLEFRRSGTNKAGMNFVYVMGAPCRLLNCRFVVRGSGTSVGTQETTAVEIRNCEFFRGGPDFSIIHAGGAPLLMENCVLASPGPTGVNLQLWKPDQPCSVLRLRHNTFALGVPLRIFPKTLGKSAAKPFFQVQAVGNLFDDGLTFDYGGLGLAKLQSPAQAEQLLKEMVAWEEQGNLWASAVQLLQLQNYFRAVPATKSWKSLADWEAFWGLNKTDSLQARFLYQNGVPFARLASDQVSASDFRLANGSPGKGAAPDGRDLGADVDLVGPGPAYERWKKTAEYQQWLKDTGQKK